MCPVFRTQVARILFCKIRPLRPGQRACTESGEVSHPNSNEQKCLNFELDMEYGITVKIVMVMLMLMVPRMSVSVPTHSRILMRYVRAPVPCERLIGTVSR